MGTVAAPIQSMASAVSGTDLNPIALVDWISSLLEALKNFHTAVDKIATVSITWWPANQARMLIRYLDSSLRASSVDYPLCCFQGLGGCVSRVTQSNLQVADNY